MSLLKWPFLRLSQMSRGAGATAVDYNAMHEARENWYCLSCSAFTNLNDHLRCSRCGSEEVAP